MQIGDPYIYRGKVFIVTDMGEWRLKDGGSVGTATVRAAEAHEIRQEDLDAIEAGRRVTAAMRGYRETS
jgi:hypothetical protein